MSAQPYSPAEHANRAFSRAESIVDAIIEYAASPSAPEDRERDFGSLQTEAARLRHAMHEAMDLRTAGVGAVANPALLAVLDEVEGLSVDALVRTHGLGIQGDQWELRQELGAAREGAS